MDHSSIRAVIDIGSNSIKILVAEFEGRTWIRTLLQHTDETRIGGYLGAGGSAMTEEALRLGVMSVEKLLERAAPHKPSAVAIVATSAVRDAENRDVFCRLVHAATGHSIRILSGEEEARGIVDGIRCDPGLEDPDHFNLLDQGGGSLEIVRVNGHSLQEQSLPLGAVRLFKQFQKGNLGPMALETREAIRQRVFDLVPADIGEAGGEKRAWSGTGGALSLIRVLLARREGCEVDDRSSELSREALEAFFQECAALPVEKRISLAGIPSARADILPAGLCAILAVMERAGIENIRHSFFNLRFGVAAQLVS